MTVHAKVSGSTNFLYIFEYPSERPAF